MAIFVAFLRAVNVGGTGRLPMADLRDLCRRLGFEDVRTYIASGNVVFRCTASRAAAKSALESSLEAYAGKHVGVVLRSPAEIRAVLDDNPFAGRDPRRTLVILLDGKPPANTVTEARGQKDEAIHLGRREIYVWYESGIGRSRLRLPAAEAGTARNVNTVRKMLDLIDGK